MRGINMEESKLETILSQILEQQTLISKELRAIQLQNKILLRYLVGESEIKEGE